MLRKISKRATTFVLASSFVGTPSFATNANVKEDKKKEIQETSDFETFSIVSGVFFASILLVRKITACFSENQSEEESKVEERKISDSRVRKNFMGDPRDSSVSFGSGAPSTFLVSRSLCDGVLIPNLPKQENIKKKTAGELKLEEEWAIYENAVNELNLNISHLLNLKSAFNSLIENSKLEELHPSTRELVSKVRKKLENENSGYMGDMHTQRNKRKNGRR